MGSKWKSPLHDWNGAQETQGRLGRASEAVVVYQDAAEAAPVPAGTGLALPTMCALRGHEAPRSWSSMKQIAIVQRPFVPATPDFWAQAASATALSDGPLHPAHDGNRGVLPCFFPSDSGKVDTKSQCCGVC